MTNYISMAAVEKLAALEKAKACIDTLTELNQKYPEVPDVSDMEAVDLAMAIEALEPERENYNKYLAELQANASTQERGAKTKPQADDLDTLAERLLNVFTDENDTRTDADLLAASGVGRDRYTDIRDFLLYETEEISETVDGIPTEYIRNWPRKAEAAA